MGTETPINAGKTIGRYHVLGEIGRGGMGVVYRAEDRLIGRQVAIKTLTEVTPELRERFYIEARSGILSHQNIVTVYELGEDEGSPFMAMEFIDGDSLEHILREKKRLPLLESLAIAEQLCAGLGYAHGHGVVHRDVKPGNVLVQPDGHVTIVDFGIARLANQTKQLTRTDALLGTFHYISPERLKGEASDGRADVWSVGVILYEMLTGHLPFRGGDISSLYRVIHEPYTPLEQHAEEMPEGLTLVLDRALAKNAEDRYATAEEMAVEIQVLADGLKLDRVESLLDTARRLKKEGQYLNARVVLLQAQRIDPNNTDTKMLLSELQKMLGQTQRNEQTYQIVKHAESAFSGKRWNDAVELLEQACKLDPGNAHNLSGLLEEAREELSYAQASRDPQGTDDEEKIQENTIAERGSSEGSQALLANAQEKHKEQIQGHDTVDAPTQTKSFTLPMNRPGQLPAITADSRGYEHVAQTKNTELSPPVAMSSTVLIPLPSIKDELKAIHKPAAAKAIQAAMSTCNRAIEAGQLDQCLRSLEEVEKQHGTSAELAKARHVCEDKRARKAKQMLDDAIHTAGRHLSKDNVAEAEKVLRLAEGALTFADGALRKRWNEQKSKCSSAKVAQRRTGQTKSAGSGRTRIWNRKFPMAIGGVGIVACIAIVGLVTVHRHHRTPATLVVAHEPVAAMPAVSLVDVEINASPWAKVLSIKDADEKDVTLPVGDQITPLRLEGIKVGTYEVTYEGADGLQKTVECEISPKNHLCTVELGELDIEKILNGAQP